MNCTLQGHKAIGSHDYWLEDSEGTRWHNVVHTTLLKPFKRRDEPQHMHDDEEEIEDVEEILTQEESKELYNIVCGRRPV